jgi:hypothetical protein
MSTALGSTPRGDHEDARFEAELSSRYEDDDDDATETTPPAAAAGAENAPDALRGAAVAGPAEDDGPGERGWADRMDEFPTTTARRTRRTTHTTRRTDTTTTTSRRLWSRST